MDISSNAGGAGGFPFDDSYNSSSQSSTGRGRVRSADFGLLGRRGLLDLARTYLETQARLWSELAGTAAVTAMADDFERRFHEQGGRGLDARSVAPPVECPGRRLPAVQR